MTDGLQHRIEEWFGRGAEAVGEAEALRVFEEFRGALERGEARAAEPDVAEALGWRVNAWVKRGILLGFRLGRRVGSSLWIRRRFCRGGLERRMGCGWCRGGHR